MGLNFYGMSIAFRKICRSLVAAIAASAVLPVVASGQDASTDTSIQSSVLTLQDPSASADGQPDQADKRILGIIPNYRTSPTLTDYRPLTSRAKFNVAASDAFDRGTFVLAALFAGDAQLTDATPSFGHGIGAYARYYPAALSDLVIGDFLTEAVYPVALRQDPRYFRRSTGSGWARLGYAVGQIFWTHTDAGRTQFNFSEIVGNATAVAVANAYYPDNRTVSSNVSKLSLQIGVDMAANILKEFWPDLNRKFSSEHPPKAVRQ